MEPIITKHKGATYFDNDREKVQYDRGGLSDNEYEQIIATKNAQITALDTELTEKTTALNAVKYAVSVSGSNVTAAITKNDVDITSAITNLASGEARNSTLVVTLTPASGYTISAVTVNSTAVTLTDNAFNLTLDSNKVIAITTAAVETPTE